MACRLFAANGWKLAGWMELIIAPAIVAAVAAEAAVAAILRMAVQCLRISKLARFENLPCH